MSKMRKIFKEVTLRLAHLGGTTVERHHPLLESLPKRRLIIYTGSNWKLTESGKVALTQEKKRNLIQYALLAPLIWPSLGQFSVCGGLPLSCL